MLQRAPTAADASITVVIEYVGAAALCRQLRALVQQQQDAKAADIWVAALRDPDGDGGDEARRIVASFKSAFGADTALSVVSSATLASADGASDASGARSLGRLARFQLGLQATTQYVLLLDGGLVPPPNLLHTLSRVSQLPEAHGILGVAGWRSILEASADSTAAAAGGTAEPSVMELNAAVGGASLSMPSSVHEEPRIDRLMAVDALRGCWFGKTSWLPLLFVRLHLPALAGAQLQQAIHWERRRGSRQCLHGMAICPHCCSRASLTAMAVVVSLQRYRTTRRLPRRPRGVGSCGRACGVAIRHRVGAPPPHTTRPPRMRSVQCSLWSRALRRRVPSRHSS